MRTSIKRGVALSVLAGALTAGGGAGQAAVPQGRYTISGGVVTDTVTGLQWEEVASVTDYNWTDAMAHCAAVTTAGGGWRAPTITELSTIFDEEVGSMDPSAFAGEPPWEYWSSTTDVEDPVHNAWICNFGPGRSDTYPAPKTDFSYHRVRCVKP